MSNVTRSSSKSRSGRASKPWEHAKSGPGSGSDPLAARFVESLSYDRRLYKQDIRGSVAHARMLRSVGLLTAGELKQIEKGLKGIEGEIDQAGADYGARWKGWRVELEDVHMCIEAALIERIGEAGKKLHTGRSRNDQVALDLLLWIGDATRELEDRFGVLLKAFVGLAGRDGRIVMPGYTHLQRAQPILVGGELVAWLEGFDRCRRRFGVMGGVLSGNPLGSGAVAGSALPLDRERVAAGLGLGEPSGSSIDSTASRDEAIGFVFGLAMTAMTLSRWAEQWIIYSTTEFSFIQLDDRYTTGSSMMPQKRNPDMLELIRGRSGGVYGNLTAILTVCKGLPLGYNRDLQEDKRHVFAAYDCVMDSLAMAARIVGTTRFRKDRIEGSLGRGFLDATSMAEHLVTRGVAFRSAHQIVGQLVRVCEARGYEGLEGMSMEEMKRECQAMGYKAGVIGEDVRKWLGAVNVVRRYQTQGNAGWTGTETQLKKWRKRLGVRGG